MKSRLLSDPYIRNLLIVLLVCLIVAAVCLSDKTPCQMGIRASLLCNYYNASPDGNITFQKGCVVVCNMSEVEIQGYLSGLTTSRTI
jgi:hypothetical protein